MAGVQGQVALVTGGAKGIGAAIVRRLAAGGASVGVLDIDPEGVDTLAAEVRAGGGKARGLVADVRERSQVEAAVQTLLDEFGGLTILVNNAGVLRDNLLFKLTDDDWATVMDVHLRGAFLCSQAAQAHMVKAGYGRIVSLSSTSALGNRGQANYSAAKAGLQGFTRTLAIELGPFGVTANAVAPGFIVTDMTRATAERMGLAPEDFFAQVAGALPVRRGGQPEDVAEAVAYLASEEAGFVTGQVLYIDGGVKLV